MTPLRAILAASLLATLLADAALLVVGISLAPLFILLWPLFLAVVTGILACGLALRWGPWSGRPPDALAPAPHLQAALAFSLIVAGFAFVVAALATFDLDWRISVACLLNVIGVVLAWWWRPWT